MEVENQVAGGDVNVSGGDVEQKNDVVAHTSYVKVLDEKKRIAKELEELKQYKQNIELEKKKQAGQHAEVIAQLQQELEQTKNQFTQEKNQHAFDKFKTQFHSIATELGCNNPDKLLALTTEEQLKMVGKDEGYNFNPESLKALMTKLKEEHSDIGMFKLADVNHTPATRVGTVPNKNINEMSRSEKLSAVAKSLLNK